MSLPFLVLDLLFYRLDCALRLNLHGFSLSGEGLDEDLHTTMKPPYKVKGRFLLDVVLRKCGTVFGVGPSSSCNTCTNGRPWHKSSGRRALSNWSLIFGSMCASCSRRGMGFVSVWGAGGRGSTGMGGWGIQGLPGLVACPGSTIWHLASWCLL